MSPNSNLPAWFATALAALGTGDLASWMAMYAEDAVHEFPFAAEGAPARLDGRAAIAAYMGQLPSRIRFGALTDVRVHEAGDTLIVEATGHHIRLPDETPFALSYVWLITRRDGQVTRFRDYMNPRQLARLAG